MPAPGGESLDRLSDDELMLLVAGGREQPFEELIRRHQSLVFGYSTRFLADRALGRDVTQEVFLTVWQERRNYAPKGRFRGYLLTVAFNRCQSVARRRRTVATKRDDVLDLSPSPAEVNGPLDSLLESERASRVRREIGRLNAKQRRAILLRFASHLSYDEIAEITGQRTGTIKSHVCRGLRKLHSLLGEE